MNKLHSSLGMLGFLLTFFMLSSYSIARANVAEAKLYRVGPSLKGHSDNVNSISFSADGKFLVSSSWDKSIRLWNIENGRMVRVIAKSNSKNSSVAISPDSTLVAYGDESSLVKLFSARTGKLLHSFKTRYPVMEIAFAANGETLLAGTGSMDEYGAGKKGEVLLWTLPTFRRRSFSEPLCVVNLSIDPSSHVIALIWAESNGEAYDRCGVDIRDMRGRRIARLHMRDSPAGEICFVSAQSFVLTVNSGQIVQKYSLKKGRWLLDRHRLETGSESEIITLVFSPLRHQILCVDLDGTFLILDPEKLGVVNKFEFGEVTLSVADISPDGRTIAAGGIDGTLQLWNMR